MNDSTSTIITRDLSINPIIHQVKKKDIVLKLPDLSYKTLMVLIEQAPAVVSIEQLTERVWQNVEVSPETVTQRIALLRKSITTKEDASNPYISSIRNQGYRWVPEVRHSRGLSQVKSFNLNYWFAIGFVLLMGLWLWQFLNNNKTETTPQIITNAITEDDYTEQAWRYLSKHDVNNNQIAIDLFRKSLKSKPNHVRALTGLSIALSHHVSKFNQPRHLLKEARLNAQKAIDLNSESANAWHALAFSHDVNGEINEAIRFYQKAIKLEPLNLLAKSSLAYSYILKGKLIEALKLNISVLGSQQIYVDLQTAYALELLGFNTIAERWYQRADELSPDNVFATHGRARFYLARNQQSKAASLIYSAIDRGVKQPELYVTLGIMDLINEKPDDAHNQIKKALSVDANDMEANLWMFILKKKADISKESIQKFSVKWFAREVSWPGEWVYKAMFEAHLGQYEKAIISIKKAYEAGYLNHAWLQQLPPFKAVLQHPDFLQVLEGMQNNVSKQRQDLLKAKWLPPAFLDPQLN